jgi:amino acid transporter
MGQAPGARVPPPRQGRPRPALARALGLRDLVSLKIAAIVNLTLIPAVAIYGGATLILWALAFVAFFVPSAIAVLSLGRRYPGEGGIYIWAHRQFGGLHGFVCSWCYWTNNLFFIPMQLIYVAGLAAFAGSDPEGLVKNRWFVGAIAFSWLALATWANVRGLTLGKWVQNVGAWSTAALAALIVAMAAAAWLSGTAAPPPPVSGTLDWGVLSVFGVMCLAFVGVELASTMDEEIEQPRRNLPRAAAAAGAVSLVSYLVVTQALFMLVPWRSIGVLQGLMQALVSGAARTHLGWIVAPTAILAALSIGGSTSAWFAGSARIPFVAGIDRELPAALGRLHPRWGSPHVALVTSAVLSALLVASTLAGATVSEAYQQLLKSTVVIQLIPFLYLFGGLMRLETASRPARAMGLLGLLAAAFATVVAFWPPRETTDALRFETKMAAAIVSTLGIGLVFYWRGRRGRSGLETPASAAVSSLSGPPLPPPGS